MTINHMLRELPVAALKQKFRAGLKGFGARHEETESIGQPISRVKRKAYRERVLDLISQNLPT